MDIYQNQNININQAKKIFVENKDAVFVDCNISGHLKSVDKNFENATFKNCIFSGIDFENANFRYANLENSKFENSNLAYADFKSANLSGMEVRNIDMTGADFCGANVYSAVFEGTILKDVLSDSKTKWFSLRCPKEGAFIGWKCCSELRVVQLLIPKDAKRVSATRESCRTDKAKVLSIKSIDETKIYDWAQSTVDPDFFYERGKWAYPANGFEEDRWKDSSRGIHFFMNRDEAIEYQTI